MAANKWMGWSTTGHVGSEIGKTVLAVGLCILSMFSNAVVLSTTHDLAPWNGQLDDVAYDTVPQQLWAVKMADGATASLAIFFFLFVPFHSASVVLARRATIIASAIYSLRAICLAATTLPVGYSNPSTICLPQTSNFSLTTILSRASLSVITMGASGGTKIPCGDLFFSGHTIVLTLVPTLFQLYSPRFLRPIVSTMWIIYFIGGLTLVISRGHYSIDILVSGVITRGFTALYHVFVALPHSNRYQARLGRYSTLLFYVQWMEARVPFGAPPTRLRWPASRPDALVRLFRYLSKE